MPHLTSWATRYSSRSPFKFSIPPRNLKLELGRAPHLGKVEPLRSRQWSRSCARSSYTFALGMLASHLIRIKDDGLGREVAVMRVVEAVVDEVAREHLHSSWRRFAVGELFGGDHPVGSYIRVGR